MAALSIQGTGCRRGCRCPCRRRRLASAIGNHRGNYLPMSVPPSTRRRADSQRLVPPHVPPVVCKLYQPSGNRGPEYLLSMRHSVIRFTAQRTWYFMFILYFIFNVGTDETIEAQISLHQKERELKWKGIEKFHNATSCEVSQAFNRISRNTQTKFQRKL